MDVDFHMQVTIAHQEAQGLQSKMQQMIVAKQMLM